MQTYDIRNFDFYSLDSLSRVTASRRPISFHFSSAFLQVAQRAKFLRFDHDLYVSLSSPLRRFYLLANQMAWKNRDSAIFDVDEFALHQIGYQDDGDRQSRDGQKLRRQKIRRLLAEAEARDLIRPCSAWPGYMQKAARGPFRGRLVLRWTRGPKLLARDEKHRSLSAGIEEDGLFDQVKQLRDEDGRPVNPIVFQIWLDKYGRNKIQKHIRVILAQKEHQPASFRKSEVAAFVDRLKHDYSDPDWYADLSHQERLALFDESKSSQVSMEMYKDFFR